MSSPKQRDDVLRPNFGSLMINQYGLTLPALHSIQHSSISRVYSSISVTEGTGSLAGGSGALAGTEATAETAPWTFTSTELLREEVSPGEVAEE